MPNRRKDAKVLALSGSFDKNPQLMASRLNAPKDIPPIDKTSPSRLTEIQKAAWCEIVTKAPRGVLTRADEASIELAAKLLAESWTSYDEMSNVRMNMLIKLLGSLGCLPSERHKIEIPDEAPKEKNPFLHLDDDD